MRSHIFFRDTNYYKTKYYNYPKKQPGTKQINGRKINIIYRSGLVESLLILMFVYLFILTDVVILYSKKVTQNQFSIKQFLLKTMTTGFCLRPLLGLLWEENNGVNLVYYIKVSIIYLKNMVLQTDIISFQ